MRSAERLIRKLQISTALDADDLKAIEQLPITAKEFPAHTAIVREGERPQQSGLLIDGFACSSKTTDAGKRQILSIYIPGDIPDLQSLHLHVMDHDVTTLSRATMGFIPHEALRALNRERPAVGEALWRETLIDAAVFREWIVNVGRRSAVMRLAHLLAEIGRRLQAMGLAPGDRFELPMTQLDIADALGLTPVHINRVVQELRRAGLLELRKQSVFLPDLPRLKEVGDFDDLYLHQREMA
jgi:CRP-like cAMP-binding protein